MIVLLERTTKLVNGEERAAVRWTGGPAYACTADGDCTDAEKRATQWGAANAPARPAVSDSRRRRFTAR